MSRPDSFPVDAEPRDSEPVGEHDAHFSTSGVRSNLKVRSVRSGFVNIGSQGIQVALTVGGTMVLARLLRPADFGLYAMVGTLIAFVGSFRDLGLPLATMHREELTHAEYSSLFWFYQRVNVAIALFIVAMGPVLSWFYGQPQLTALTAAMALGVFLLGLSVQHEALLKRQMRFPALTVLNVSATIAGVAAGITAAVLGAGYWSLVIQFLAMCASKAAGSWMVSHWRPAWRSGGGKRAVEGVKRLMTYGLDVTASGMIKHVARNIDSVLVGYFAGAQALGFYHHADKWANFPARQMYAPLRHVAVSGLSRVQNEPRVYRAYARRGFLPVFSVTMPAIAFLFVEADRVIDVLLGAQWMPAVPLFRILCIAAFIGKMSTVTRWLFLSSGKTRPLLRLDVITAPIMIAAVTTGVYWGVQGVAIGFTVGNALLLYPTIWYCLRHTPLRLGDLARVVWRPATASIVAAVLTFAVQATGMSEGWHALVALPLHGAIFTAAYAATWLLLPGGRDATREVMQLLEALPLRRGTAPEHSASGESAGSPLAP